MIDAYIAQTEMNLAQIAQRSGPQTDGERFVMGMGQTIYGAMLEYLRAHRAEIEGQPAQAAE
jgi:hypothetical protein